MSRGKVALQLVSGARESLLAKGYGAKSKKYRESAVMKSGNYAYRIGRRRSDFAGQDYQNQCCRSYERYALQHVHLWFEEKRRRSEPRSC